MIVLLPEFANDEADSRCLYLAVLETSGR